MKREKRLVKITGVFMFSVAFCFLIPIYFVVINSFKDYKSVILETGAFPNGFYINNFIEVLEKADFLILFKNSVIVTVVSVLGIVLFGAMAGYKLARLNRKWAVYLLAYFMLTMIIPFQSIMIPLVSLMEKFKLYDSLYGLILVYMGMGIPVGVFLYYGGVRSIDRSLEDSAYIDGAGKFTTFFRVIFPILKPITSTVVILESLWIWNDFLLPLIVLQTPSIKTISVGTMSLIMGQYMSKLNLAAAATVMASLPMLLLFLFMQRYIIEGVVDGALKG